MNWKGIQLNGSIILGLISVISLILNLGNYFNILPVFLDVLRGYTNIIYAYYAIIFALVNILFLILLMSKKEKNKNYYYLAILSVFLGFFRWYYPSPIVEILGLIILIYSIYLRQKKI
jgi:hypothetical protein